MLGSGMLAYSPPVITSITPNPWYSGTNGQSFTVQGRGFGTNPSLDVSGTGIASGTTTIVSSGDTSIMATVPISQTNADGSAVVTVTSNGYYGSGFWQPPGGSGGTPGQAQGSVTIKVPPVPQITFNGANITGQTVSVYVGQQIALTAIVPGVTVQTQTWSVTGTIVGGYNASIQSGAVITLPASGGVCQQSFNLSCLTFYWVTSGATAPVTQTVSYTYTAAGVTNPPVATATFTVYGPAITTPITTQVGGAGAIPGPDRLVNVIGLQPSFSPGKQTGIIFTTPALPALGDAGTYMWAQLITGDTTTLQTGSAASNGVQTCTPPGAFPQLDLAFPYGIPNGSLFSVNRPNDTATDNPTLKLNAAWGEARRLFSATMYLMWDPTLPSGCTAASPSSTSTCASIPIPIASVAWQSAGDGINTLQTQNNRTNWIVPCGPGSASPCATVTPSMGPHQSFPEWSTTFTGGSITCVPKT
jgi:hypothetical protein